MKALHVICVIVLTLLTTRLFAQQLPVINILDSGHKTSLRGLSVVNNDIVWASGSNGTVARSTDGGKTFTWLTVAGYEKRDFRDVEAFDENTALIMAVDEPGIILKTVDGGKNWQTVFVDSTKGMFMDAMNFAGKTGIVVGDPLQGFAFLAYTKDGGNTWHKLEGKANKVKVDKDEAFFASSGTNVKIVTNGDISTNQVWMVSGGSKARLIKDDTMFGMPMLQGANSQGANSIDVMGNKAVVVGGDFAHDTVTNGNCVLFDISENNIVFTKPQTPPHGYRSCVVFVDRKHLVTCGTSGVDISVDGGNNWLLVTKQSFHVCQKAKRGDAVYLAGGGGRIARLK